MKTRIYTAPAVRGLWQVWQTPCTVMRLANAGAIFAMVGKWLSWLSSIDPALYTDLAVFMGFAECQNQIHQIDDMTTEEAYCSNNNNSSSSSNAINNCSTTSAPRAAAAAAATTAAAAAAAASAAAKNEDEEK